jgi:hypothetical protein
MKIEQQQLLEKPRESMVGWVKERNPTRFYLI